MSKALRYSSLIALLLNMTSVFTLGQEKGTAAGAPRGERVRGDRAGGGGVGRDMPGGGPSFRANRIEPGQQPQADMSRWALGPMEAINSESQDVIFIAANMYGLQGQESAMLEKSVAIVQESRWHSSGPNDKFESMMERRAAIFNKVAGGRENGPDAAQVYKELNDNPEFVEVNHFVTMIESQRQLNLAEFIPVIEASLPPDVVELARQNWAANAKKISINRLKNKTLGIQMNAGSYQAMMSANSTTHPEPLEKTVPMRPQRAAYGPSARQPQRPVIEQKPVALGGQPNSKPITKPSVTPPPPPPRGAPVPVARPIAKPAVGAHVPTQPPRPLNEWEKYVLEFISKHQLSETQKNSALGILRDMTARANQIQKANESRLKSVESIKDPKVKSEKMRELTAPIDGLFERLKVRLELLLNTQQREQAAGPAKPKQ